MSGTVFVVRRLFSACASVSTERSRFLRQFRHKRLDESRKKELGMSKLSMKEKEVKPIVYMRTIIVGVSRILRYSTWESAKEELEKLCLKWDSYTINQVLKTHPPMEKAWLFFNWCSQLKGFKHDQFTYTTMLDIFGEAGRIETMKQLFHQMAEKRLRIDAVTYTSVLHWLSKYGDIEGALNIWKKMKSEGCLPTVVSYTALMKVLFDNGRPKEAAAVYKEMIEAGCSPNCYTYTILVEYLAGSGKFKEAFDILCKMQDAGVQPDKVTCNILVHKCSIAREMFVLIQTLQYMKENSLVLRRPMYLEALEALRSCGQNDELLNEVNPHFCHEGFDDCRWDLSPDPQHYADRGVLINLVAKKSFVAAEYLLEGMMEKNIQFDTKLVSSMVMDFCSNHHPSGALVVLKYSSTSGLQLERDAYICMIGLFIRLSLYGKVMVVTEEMLRKGVHFGTYLVALLIYQFGCAGMPDLSERLFYALPCEQNTATYTALMDAFVKSGDFDKALTLYKKMSKERVPITSGTLQVLQVGLEGPVWSHGNGIYRQLQKLLPDHGHLQDNILWEQRLCNVLFDNAGNR
ncbi:pentatricopeptide repeat-containing protein At2g01390 isoform X1 [Nymphaea colorata]|nr:pentatricopeptide repeat-containing protein At2g01390 isoform X1 [Nymphaea colorata]